jgi:hypothetical protein
MLSWYKIAGSMLIIFNSDIRLVIQVIVFAHSVAAITSASVDESAPILCLVLLAMRNENVDPNETEKPV